MKTLTVTGLKINFKPMSALTSGVIENLDIVYVLTDDYELYEAVVIYEDSKFKLYTNTDESWEIVNPLAWSPVTVDKQDVESI